MSWAKTVCRVLKSRVLQKEKKKKKCRMQERLKADCVRCATVHVLPGTVYQQRCGSSWLKIAIFSRISWLSVHIVDQSAVCTQHIQGKIKSPVPHCARLYKSSVSTLKFKSLAIFISSAVTNHFWAGLNLVIHFMPRSFQIRSMGIPFSKMALCFLQLLFQVCFSG